MRTLVLILALSLVSNAASAITYQVDRTIGEGTVVGFIETDGTLGNLTTDNLTDWLLTVTAPNLLGGSPEVFSFSGYDSRIVTEGATIATPTELLFDFSAPYQRLFYIQGTPPVAGVSGNFWQLGTGGGCCAGVPGEYIGQADTGVNAAQSRLGQSGIEVFGSVVPEPSTALLMGLGLAGLASRRR